MVWKRYGLETRRLRQVVPQEYSRELVKKLENKKKFSFGAGGSRGAGRTAAFKGSEFQASFAGGAGWPSRMRVPGRDKIRDKQTGEERNYRRLSLDC